jgi:hypothetical protein
MVHDEKFVVVRKNEQDSVVLLLNGQMQSVNVAMLTKELSEIKEANLSKNKPLTVIIDMEHLTHITPGVGYSIKQSIEETNWDERILQIRNIGTDIWAILEMEGLGDFLEKMN